MSDPREMCSISRYTLERIGASKACQTTDRACPTNNRENATDNKEVNHTNVTRDTSLPYTAQGARARLPAATSTCRSRVSWCRGRCDLDQGESVVAQKRNVELRDSEDATKLRSE